MIFISSDVKYILFCRKRCLTVFLFFQTDFVSDTCGVSSSDFLQWFFVDLRIFLVCVFMVGVFTRFALGRCPLQTVLQSLVASQVSVRG